MVVLNAHSVFGQEKSAASFDLYGRVTGGVYVNDYFGFEMGLPADWIPIEQEETTAVLNMTTDAAKGKNQAANKTIDRAASLSTVILFYAKEPVGSIENASMAIAVAKQPSKYVTSKMVIETTKSAYLRNETTKLIRDYRVEIYGGKEFAAVDLELESMGNRIPLRFLVTVINGYSLTFSLSSLTDDSWDPIYESVKSIRFIPKSKATSSR